MASGEKTGEMHPGPALGPASRIPTYIPYILYILYMYTYIHTLLTCLMRCDAMRCTLEAPEGPRGGKLGGAGKWRGMMYPQACIPPLQSPEHLEHLYAGTEIP